jgi:hypothetical protein
LSTGTRCNRADLTQRLIVRQQARLEHLRHAHEPGIDRQIAVVEAAVVDR